MWVVFETINEGKSVIYLPFENIKNYMEVKFGRNREIAKVIRIKGKRLNSTFENPIKIKISSSLKEKLLIKETLKYRLKIKDNLIIIGPVIGFLLGSHNNLYTPIHMEKYSDRFGIYDKVGGLIYAFSPNTIDWEKRKIYGLYYNINSLKWEYGVFPFPDVVYRRNFHSSNTIIKKLRLELNDRVFNSHRFNKYELYDFLIKDDNLKKHLPLTKISNEENVTFMFDRFEKIILKPIDLSRGRGILIAEKEGDKVKIYDYRKKENSIFKIEKDEFISFLKESKLLSEKYLVQQYIKLKKYKDCLFDIRVVMQKGVNKEWGCSGIECRVAKINTMVTNISKGATAHSIESVYTSLFNDRAEEEKRKLIDFCQKLCCYLDTIGEIFGEFGIDVALDEEDNFWVIEVNVFPSFKGFKQMDYLTYLNIRYNPLLYAKSLTEFEGD
ncbi:MAG: YheC/YheD family protein [Caloramator sp.]|nr:YheC/YheD family protein [Caloramator sp.]